MEREIDDGVYIDKDLLIIDEKKNEFPLSARVIQFLIIAIAAWAGIRVLVESFGIPCNIFQINAAVLICTGIFYALCLYPAYDILKLFFTILFYGLYLYSRLPRLANSFYILENLTMDRISSYYGTQNIQFIADYTVQEKDTTLFVVMIVIPLVALLSISVLRSRLVWLSSSFLILPVVACFAFGLVPSERYLIVYVVSVIYLMRSSNNTRSRYLRKHKPMFHKISSKAAIWLSMISILVFFAMKIFVTHEEYNNMTRIEEMKTKLQTSMRSFSWEDFTRPITKITLFYTKANYGGLSGGVLGKSGQVQYTNLEHLKIKATMRSVEEGIYLKGYVGSVYTGDSWDGHSAEIEKKYGELKKKLLEKMFSPENQMSQILSSIANKNMVNVAGSAAVSDFGLPAYSVSIGTMDIEYENANKTFLYTPYFTDYERIPDIRFNSDLYAKPTVRIDNLTLNYFFNVSIDYSKPDFYSKLREAYGDAAEYERLYRDFVNKAYTILPENGLTRIKRDFSADHVKTENGSISEKIEYVRNYLEQNTEYSLSPGRLPKGKDFAEYFLYENKAGYCAHYASAATLMLRAMDIPTRYVEGYAVGRGDIAGARGIRQVTRNTNEGSVYNMDSLVEVSVRDYNAHAWVEVYFDRIGWIPVEFTPGAPVDYNRTLVADMDEVTQSLKENEDNAAQEEQMISPSPAVITPEIPLSHNDEALRDNQGGASGKNGSSADILYLILLIATILLLAIFYFLIRKNIANRARTTGSYNKRAIYLYGDIEKLLIFCRYLPKKALLEENEAYIMESSAYIDAIDLEQLMKVVRKARFGQGVISGQELELVRKCRNRLFYMVYNELSIVKKFHLSLKLS